MIGDSIVSSHEDGLDKLARHARTVLVLLAALVLVWTAILWVAGAIPDRATLMVNVVVGGVFAALAVWARQNPLPAVVTGAALYAANIGLAAVVDPNTLFEGLLLKLIVVIMFYNGIDTALTHRKMKLTAPPKSPGRPR